MIKKLRTQTQGESSQLASQQLQLEDQWDLDSIGVIYPLAIQMFA